jgi:hypothetical protein
LKTLKQLITLLQTKKVGYDIKATIVVEQFYQISLFPNARSVALLMTVDDVSLSLTPAPESPESVKYKVQKNNVKNIIKIYFLFSKVQ